MYNQDEAQLYTQYYNEQALNGLGAIYSGSAFQRGHGIGKY